MTLEQCIGNGLNAAQMAERLGISVKEVEKKLKELFFKPAPYARITVEGHFSAGHYLPKYDGVCKRVHAHCWKYAVTVRGRIDVDTGMVMDYKVLKNYLKEMENVIDHRMLNDVFPFEPTSENLAVWMWEYLNELGLEGLYEIKLYESEKCYTTLNAADMVGSAY